MKTKIIPALLFMTVMMWTACDHLVCGNLAPELQKRVDRVESNYGKKVKVEPIPCEFSYVKLILKGKDTTGVPLNAIHDILHDSATRQGWAVMWVYDKEDKYLFSHHWRGKIYQQTGD
jgi:hypothetical protein